MPYSILIVEGEHFIATLFRDNLEDSSHRVDIAMDAEDAIESMKRRQPNIILLDLQLPRDGALSVLQFLKSHMSASDIPVLIFTDESPSLNKKKCKELGAADYILKRDINPTDLPMVVAKYLD